jgi:hypothetical protein
MKPMGGIIAAWNREYQGITSIQRDLTCQFVT